MYVPFIWWIFPDEEEKPEEKPAQNQIWDQPQQKETTYNTDFSVSQVPSWDEQKKILESLESERMDNQK